MKGFIVEGILKEYMIPGLKSLNNVFLFSNETGQEAGWAKEGTKDSKKVYWTK